MGFRPALRGTVARRSLAPPFEGLLLLKKNHEHQVMLVGWLIVSCESVSSGLGRRRRCRSLV